MIRVIIESPYGAPTPEGIEENLTYLRQCLRDAIMRGESPYASHATLPQPGVLDDSIPDERSRGIQAGYAWGPGAEGVAFYIDRGMSPGMQAALEHWSGGVTPGNPALLGSMPIRIVFRTLKVQGADFNVLQDALVAAGRAER